MDTNTIYLVYGIQGKNTVKSLCDKFMKCDELKLWIFKKKMLRRIYEPCRDLQMGKWSKRYNKELYNLYNRPNIANEIKRKILEWGGHA